MIKDIDEKKETLKLVVRVKDLWFVQNRDTNRHMELILLDQKVKKICCSFYSTCGMILFGSLFLSRFDDSYNGKKMKI